MRVLFCRDALRLSQVHPTIRFPLLSTQVVTAHSGPRGLAHRRGVPRISRIGRPDADRCCGLWAIDRYDKVTPDRERPLPAAGKRCTPFYQHDRFEVRSRDIPLPASRAIVARVGRCRCFGCSAQFVRRFRRPSLIGRGAAIRISVITFSSPGDPHLVTQSSDDARSANMVNRSSRHESGNCLWRNISWSWARSAG